MPMPNRSLANLSLALVAIGAASGAVATFAATPVDMPRWGLLVLNVVYWGGWALLVPVAVRLAGWIRQSIIHTPAAIAAHLAAATLCGLTHLTALSLVHIAVSHGGTDVPGQRLPQRIVSRIEATGRRGVEWELTMYAAIAVFSYALALQLEAQRRDVALAQLQTGLSEARLLSLQRQLRPHFLFNTLHAIAALIRRDPDTAEAMIARLSGLLRTTFRSGEAAEVRFADDLATLEDYLAIESAQMRDRLDIAFDIEPGVLDAAVPVLLLQPLVENAVRHGLQPRASGGHVRIAAKRSGADLCIDIVDDGVGLREAPGATPGVGLANTRSRLQQMYADRWHFSVNAVQSGGVHVRVRVPFRPFAPTMTRGAAEMRAS